MAKYRMTKEVDAEKFDGTMESCVRILEMIGFPADEFSIHIYGNHGKKVVFDHKRREIEFDSNNNVKIIYENRDHGIGTSYPIDSLRHGDVRHSYKIKNSSHYGFGLFERKPFEHRIGDAIVKAIHDAYRHEIKLSDTYWERDDGDGWHMSANYNKRKTESIRNKYPRKPTGFDGFVADMVRDIVNEIERSLEN
ncbi:MAG: hypothetical protein KAJ03_10730 [Gammaproteobacteria bacterium]|nr:hypothetical protein [Gammaproteobacteria bacterium]